MSFNLCAVDTFSDDNDDLPEKKPKRKVKTPAQIGGLERLYEGKASILPQILSLCTS